MEAKDRLIFALDIDKEKALPLLDQLQGKVGMIKVNSLAAEWPEAVGEIKSRGLKVWRDWKHHDIPGTVANFIKADVKIAVDMCTVHTIGGSAMMEAAVEAKDADLKILGITILTSHSQLSFNVETGIQGAIQDKVIDLALRAEEAGLDGVVASAKEATALRKVLKPKTLIVTPGITPIWAAKREDQARVTTPKQAIINGSDYIVVGSAIYKAENPAEAADKIVAEIKEGLKEIEWRVDQRDLAFKLFDAGIIKFGAFKLKLHEKQPDAPLSPIYIDLRITRSIPGLLVDVAEILDKKAARDGIEFELIADIPTAATPIVTIMSFFNDKPMISPKISKTHGLSGEIDGLFEPGQKVLLIDDLVTTADSKIEAAEIFEKNRLIIKDILVLVDREQGGHEALLQAGYKLHSVFKITEMLELYLEAGRINQEKYDETIAYLKGD
ncbi:MAG: orotidine-5'-phosphate decarboxylase [bacterium]